MTIRPKAKRFRIRLSDDAAGTGTTGAARKGPADDADYFEPAIQNDALHDVKPRKAGAKAPPAANSTDAELAAIAAEGLTGRQLRMARRLAMKHGLEPASDHDAVRLLRARGIDPFSRANMLELVIGKNDGEEPPRKPVGTELARIDQDKLPSKIRRAPPPPSPEVFAEEERAKQILAIQRDIARRRQRRLMLLCAHLFFFVLIPTMIAGYYYYRMATPLYATNSEMVIQQAEGQQSALGGLFSGTGLATSQDSITVQSYLQSREAFQRLDQDLNFTAHFSDESIDPIHRLPADATNEAAYRLYKRMVKIGYDPTEGIIKMEVIAPDPQLARDFSIALIGYAEEQVDQLTQRLREDQMSGALSSYQDAEAKMIEAQRRVVDLQESYNVLSSDIEVNLLTSRISQLEGQLTQERLNLQELLANTTPNRARVDPLERRIETLETEIAGLRSRLTQDSGGETSLARIRSEMLLAESDVQTRQMMLSQSLQQLEAARIEANKQVRYLSLGVRPIAPDEASYPRAFENTALVFLIFAGLYLMLSMTASILREQVSG